MQSNPLLQIIPSQEKVSYRKVHVPFYLIISMLLRLIHTYLFPLSPCLSFIKGLGILNTKGIGIFVPCVSGRKSRRGPFSRKPIAFARR